jgi:hypothetical protein
MQTHRKLIACRGKTRLVVWRARCGKCSIEVPRMYARLEGLDNFNQRNFASVENISALRATHGAKSA